MKEEKNDVMQNIRFELQFKFKAEHFIHFNRFESNEMLKKTIMIVLKDF